MADSPLSGREVIGLMPAAGLGSRISPMPCSKEVYPLLSDSGGNGQTIPKGACSYLLEKMRVAGVRKSYIVMRQGKWDIPAYLLNGDALDMDLAYLVMGTSFGVPYTLDQAYPFVRDAVVAFGFPDVLVYGDDVFVKLLEHQSRGDGDAVLGLFPADRPDRMDVVDLGEGGRVRGLIIRPRKTEYRYTWNIAVWTPRFTRFLHEYVDERRSSARIDPEISVGNVFQEAIRRGLKIDGVPVSEQACVDIGTVEGLARALKSFSTKAPADAARS